MATNLDDIQAKITTDSDTSSLESFGDHLQNIADIAGGIITAKIFENLADSVMSFVSAGFEAASSAEMMRIGFESAFGSGTSSILSNIDDLSYKTPLLATQMDNMALKLKTAGEASQDIVSTLKDIANTASGTGTSMEDISQKADSMAQALARANQYGKVSSLMLRPLISDNIPIIDALVKVINDSGGAYDQSAKSIAENTKKIEEAKAKHDSLVHQISDEQKQLDILAETHIKVGFAVKDSQKIIDAHNKSVEDGKYKLQQLNDELAKTEEAMKGVAAHPITKEDLLSNSKSIDITAQQLQGAIGVLGQKYTGDAEKQAKTLAGTWQNLGKAYIEMAKDIIGVNKDDTIRKGSLFETLKKNADEFFGFLQSHKGQIDDFFKNELKVMIDYLTQHHSDIEKFFKDMLKNLQDLGSWITNNKQSLTEILNIIMGIVKFADSASQNLAFFTGGAQGYQKAGATQQAFWENPIVQNVGRALHLNGGSSTNNTHNYNITNNNNMQSAADWNVAAQYQAWQISNRSTQ